MTEAWWLVVLPGLAIISAVLSVMVLAEMSRRSVQDR
jgi:ABC-type dipeptide/oligopeptide/nickel transport system permease subunit